MSVCDVRNYQEAWFSDKISPSFQQDQKKVKNLFAKSVGNAKVFLKVPSVDWSKSSCR